MGAIESLRIWGKTILDVYKPVLVDKTNIKGMHTFHRPAIMVDNGAWAITDAWVFVESLDDRFLYTEIQVLNPTAGDINFSIAIHEIEAEPDSTNLWLADEVVLGSRCMWQWQGRKSNIGNFFYVKGSASGLVLRAAAEEVPV
jgi:hypothetical protein